MAPDDRGEPLFRTECPRLRFATQVRGQVRQLVNEHGHEGYRERCRHPFPAAQMARLERQIALRKGGLRSSPSS